MSWLKHKMFLRKLKKRLKESMKDWEDYEPTVEGIAYADLELQTVARVITSKEEFLRWCKESPDITKKVILIKKNSDGVYVEE